MLYDPKKYEVNEVVLVLMNAQALIRDKRHWCQGNASILDPDGTTRLCAVAALVRANSIGVTDNWNRSHFVLHSAEANVYLHKAAKELHGNTPAQVNDRIGHEAVMRVYDRAIELARA